MSPGGKAGRGRRAGTGFYLPFKDPYGKYKLVAAGKTETIGIQGPFEFMRLCLCPLLSWNIEECVTQGKTDEDVNRLG